MFGKFGNFLDLTLFYIISVTFLYYQCYFFILSVLRFYIISVTLRVRKRQHVTYGYYGYYEILGDFGTANLSKDLN